MLKFILYRIKLEEEDLIYFVEISMLDMRSFQDIIWAHFELQKYTNTHKILT